MTLIIGGHCKQEQPQKSENLEILLLYLKFIFAWHFVINEKNNQVVIYTLLPFNVEHFVSS